jgi:hypothetical protein
VAVFAGFGSFASARAFTGGFGAAIWVSSGLAVAGALCGLALPSRRRRESIGQVRSIPEAAIELKQAA